MLVQLLLHNELDQGRIWLKNSFLWTDISCWISFLVSSSCSYTNACGGPGQKLEKGKEAASVSSSVVCSISISLDSHFILCVFSSASSPFSCHLLCLGDLFHCNTPKTQGIEFRHRKTNQKYKTKELSSISQSLTQSVSQQQCVGLNNKD